MKPCIEWGKSRHRDGYGWAWDSEKKMQILAHRLAYQQAHGPIPDGMCVLHSCDNPACVEPTHLSLGTPKENAQDRSERGRHHCQRKTHCPHGHPLDGVKASQRYCKTCDRERRAA